MRGTELNFRDTWKFNVAGYELAKMLQLNMVPPYVERRYQRRAGVALVVGERRDDGAGSRTEEDRAARYPGAGPTRCRGPASFAS